MKSPTDFYARSPRPSIDSAGSGYRELRANRTSFSSLTSNEEQLCRVCRCGDECGPLFYPCRCKGSIRYVHEDCLVQWLKISQKRSCELCLTEFEFRSVYQKDTPLRLSSIEIFLGSVKLGIKLLPQAIRLLVLGVVWLGLFPVYTARIHNLLFARRVSNVVNVLLSWNLDGIVWDCFFGLFLAAWIVCAFLALMVLQDYVRRNEWGNGPYEHLNMRHFNFRRELERGLDRNIVDIADRVVEAAVAAAADANELVEEIQAAHENHPFMVWLNNNNNNNQNNVEPQLHPLETEQETEFANNNVQFDTIQEGNDENGNVEELEDIDVDENLFEEEDEEEEEEEEEREVAWDVLVGLRGGLKRGLYTMILVSIANTSFLVIFQFIPFTVGRLFGWLYRNYLGKLDGSVDCDIEEDEHNDNVYVLFTGYGVLLSGVLIYLLQRKFVEALKGRATSAPDIVSQYAMPVWLACLDIISMGLITFLELFLLEEIVGWILHVGIMGVSGDFLSVLSTRCTRCVQAPLTCIFIHFAVGSVVVANWGGLVWAFRQVVHPYFRVRFFDGWYEKSKGIQMSLFGPLIRMQERKLREQATRWKNRIMSVTSRINEEKSKFGGDTAFKNDLDKMCLDQAPIAEPEVENMTQSTMISASVEESLSYVLTVMFWSIPAVLVFLLIPIQIIKYFMPWVFPLRIGTFREPFADAQFPLDVFLFLSSPYVVDKLHLGQVLLDTAQWVAELITRPLDLHGYVLKPKMRHMRTGFVHVDRPFAASSSSTTTPSSSKKELAKNISVRKVFEPLELALPSLNVVSTVDLGKRVDLIGMVCFLPPSKDIDPALRSFFYSEDNNLTSLAEKQRFRRGQKVHVFTISDCLGFCIPVFLDCKFFPPMFWEGKDEDEIFETHEQDVERLRRVIGQFCEIIDTKYPSLADRCVRIKETYAENRHDIIRTLRSTREEVQDYPQLVDEWIKLLPEGFGKYWDGNNSSKVIHAIHRIARLWHARNIAPVVALRNVTISSKFGRSIMLDPQSLVLLEPDCGGKAELVRICFDVRRADNPTGGQFCVLRHEPKHLTLRLQILALFAVVAAICASITIIVAPLLSGRLAFALVGDPLKHDIYHWIIGCLAIWLFGSLSKWFLSTALGKDGGWKRALYLCVLWGISACKWCVVIFLFGVTIPFVTGLLFELVVLDPLKVGSDQTPTTLIFQDWALGLALLKAWSRLVLLGVFGDSVWINRIEKIHHNASHGINLKWTILHVAFPFLDAVLFRICVPYAFTRAIQYTMELTPEESEFMMRYSFPIFSGLILLQETLIALFNWLDTLHDTIRDDRYMIGQQLQNRWH